MVTIKIEGMTFTRPLLDMSANVNILPKAIFYQFQLGALQPLFIELRLADGSVRGPHGLIEDVIVTRRDREVVDFTRSRVKNKVRTYHFWELREN